MAYGPYLTCNSSLFLCFENNKKNRFVEKISANLLIIFKNLTILYLEVDWNLKKNVLKIKKKLFYDYYFFAPTNHPTSFLMEIAANYYIKNAALRITIFFLFSFFYILLYFPPLWCFRAAVKCNMMRPTTSPATISTKSFVAFEAHQRCLSNGKVYPATPNTSHLFAFFQPLLCVLGLYKVWQRW